MSDTERHGVYTDQISIAPKYHDELSDEAKKTGRSLTNIMAGRVEMWGALRDSHDEMEAQLTEAHAEIKRLTAENRTLKNVSITQQEKIDELEADLTDSGWPDEKDV